MHDVRVLLALSAFSAIAEMPTIRFNPEAANKAELNTNVFRLVLEPGQRPANNVAVLVNATNDWLFNRLPDVPFNPFRSEFMVTVDPLLKHQNISIGTLSGQDKYPTWRQVGVLITNLPPVVVITNPVSGTTSVALLQIQGFADEALKKITYSFAKPNGETDRGDGFVTRQDMGFHPLTARTNYFQCFDIELEPGTNRFAVRCEDFYGNVTTTNLVVVLDLETDKTPPGIEIISPERNERVPDRFSVVGRLDDPSAEIACEIVSGEKRFRDERFEVGRKGEFAFEPLQVLGDTNLITLIAKDKAGNTSRTNFTVLRGNYAFGTDAIPEGEWQKPVMKLSGRITVQDRAVWVNGARATVNADGTWNVKVQRPNYENFPPFQYKLIPLSEVPAK